MNMMNESSGRIVADFETLSDKLVEFLVNLARFLGTLRMKRSMKRHVDGVEEVLGEGTGNGGWLREMVVTHVDENAGGNTPDFAHSFLGEKESVTLENAFGTDVVESDVLGADKLDGRKREKIRCHL